MAHELSRDQRPSWPRRAIVTAGMPYGNKGLHFGHVGGVFVPADFYARFLRDRLGRENVIFVSGTDCYGSPIMEGFRKRREADGYKKHISDYVRENHDSQETDLASFGVSCDLYAGSALEPAVHIHERVTSEIIRRLHEKGALEKRSTKQFYDPKAGQFLNGRQVLGHCPIQGCKSEKAYADECDLGHQFEPEELIAPKSALTGETPELVPVDNLYYTRASPSSTPSTASKRRSTPCCPSPPITAATSSALRWTKTASPQPQASAWPSPVESSTKPPATALAASASSSTAWS